MNDGTKNAADERRRAKEAYLKSLADIKGRALESELNFASNTKPENQQLSAAQKREMMLEEKRKSFFSKKSQDTGSVTAQALEVKSVPNNQLNGKLDLTHNNYGNYGGDSHTSFPQVQVCLDNTFVYFMYLCNFLMTDEGFILRSKPFRLEAERIPF